MQFEELMRGEELAAMPEVIQAQFIIPKFNGTIPPEEPADAIMDKPVTNDDINK